MELLKGYDLDTIDVLYQRCIANIAMKLKLNLDISEEVKVLGAVEAKRRDLTIEKAKSELSGLHKASNIDLDINGYYKSDLKTIYELYARNFAIKKSKEEDISHEISMMAAIDARMKALDVETQKTELDLSDVMPRKKDLYNLRVKPSISKQYK